MSVFKTLQAGVTTTLESVIAEGKLPEGTDLTRITLEPPRDPSHGDASTNAAMVLSKQAGMKPRDLAAILAPAFEAIEGIGSAEIAGPGFINLRLDNSVWLNEIAVILKAGKSYGDSDTGAGEKVNVEYVSANPTGPLHIGHARGTVVGDVLADLLKKTGYDVTKEYYINDAGSQVDTLARSAYLRYREAHGEDIGTIPEGLYPGEYLKAVGERLKSDFGTDLLEKSEEEWLAQVRLISVEVMMDLIREDLASVGVHQEVFTSEQSLVEAGKVDAVLENLDGRGLLYTGVLEPPKGMKPEDWEARPQTLFKATEFGDDVDRPLKKSDGSWTYFASDIANHLDKFDRGFAQQIDIWGADHGGYVKRMKAAVRAITGEQGELDVKLCQIVRLMDKGEPVKMSKRSGSFVTLRDLVNEVGKDAVRFFLMTRKNDAQMDFDLSAVLETTRDNPVFYVQYAHARCHSVLRQAQEAFPDSDFSFEALQAVDLSQIGTEEELQLIRQLAEWPRLIEAAAKAHEPHRIAYFLYDVAAAFHGLYTKGREDTMLRFVVPGHESLTLARLALVGAVRTVIASGLDVFGVEPVEELH